MRDLRVSLAAEKMNQGTKSEKQCVAMHENVHITLKVYQIYYYFYCILCFQLLMILVYVFLYSCFDEMQMIKALLK